MLDQLLPLLEGSTDQAVQNVVSDITYGLNRSAWLGTEHTTGSGMKLIGRYDVESRSGLTNQTLSVKARWAF